MPVVLEGLRFTQEQIDERRSYLGSSDMYRLTGGYWQELWLEKTGRKEPDDLTGNLRVQLGLWTEEFNRQWYEQQTGLQVEPMIVRNNESDLYRHPVLNFAGSRCDGFVFLEELKPAVFEAKHTAEGNQIDEMVSRYYPQLQWEMWVIGAAAGLIIDKAVLSVLFGNKSWDYRVVEFDPAFTDELVDYATTFWWHVRNDQMPEAGIVPKRKVDPKTLTKVVNMVGNNRWASLADDFLTNYGAAEAFKSASKELKTLVPEDAWSAFGHGITAKRDRRGAVRITPSKDD